jgi:ubiquitin carboxyl-terminal hydrolase 14
MKINFGDEEENLIKHLFNIELKVTQPSEDESEEAKVSIEKCKELRCYIDNNNKPINHLMEGIKLCMGDTQRMNNLPPYLVVNLVRFFWKKESSTAGTSAGKAKILRSVSFPVVLDVYDICSEELQKSLDHGRKFEAKLREEHDNKILSGIEEEAKKEEAKKEEDKKDKDVEMEEEKKGVQTEEEKKTTKKPKVIEATIKDHIVYRPHGTGLDHGKYQLMGVVTHQGRTADAGHYIGWIHSTGDDWYQCDDDFVTRVKTEDILNLKGGGDWHMAYMLVYRKLEVCKGDEI